MPQEEVTPDTCVNPFSRHFGSATAHLVKSEGISGCIRSSCFLIWKISMPPSCLAATATSRNRKNTQEKTYLNPGSLGLALDDVGGHAHFAILTLENSTWQIECFQIPYDLEGYLAEFNRAELETHGSVLARSLKRTLTCGINYFYLTVKRVRELADALALTDLDEELWEKAERELK